MFFEINFTIDTGYDWLQHVCVVVADDKKDAEEKFNNWINSRLHGENFVVDSETKIELKHETEYGIIYQSCFEKY